MIKVKEKGQDPSDFITLDQTIEAANALISDCRSYTWQLTGLETALLRGLEAGLNARLNSATKPASAYELCLRAHSPHYLELFPLQLLITATRLFLSAFPRR